MSYWRVYDIHNNNREQTVVKYQKEWIKKDILKQIHKEIEIGLYHIDTNMLALTFEDVFSIKKYIYKTGFQELIEQLNWSSEEELLQSFLRDDADFLFAHICHHLCTYIQESFGYAGKKQFYFLSKIEVK